MLMPEWSDKNFEPVRRRWFVQRTDYGREVAIVQTIEDARGFYRFLEARPRVTTWMTDDDAMAGYSPLSQMTGNESVADLYSPDEAQELMDALWAAGMRPTRR